MLGDTAVTLGWSAVTGAQYYSLGLRDISTNQFVVNQTLTGTTLTVSLARGRPYRWNLAACNSGGCSTYTERHFFQTPTDVALPSPPSDVSHGDSCDGGPALTTNVLLELDGPGAGAAFLYDINVTDSATGESIVDRTTTEPSYLAALEGDHAYWWNVAACNSAGCVGYDMTRRYFQTPAASGVGDHPLNDTGIDWCADETTNFLPCPVDGYPGQDAQDGRDVTHNDPSDGHAGFSFTKLDASGNPLAASASSWSCVRDNVTGLIWEVKTDDGGLRDKDWTYSWYNPDATANGGSAGYADYGNNCFDPSRCDTDKYVADINGAGLCGASDWRLPADDELLSIVSDDRTLVPLSTRTISRTRRAHGSGLRRRMPAIRAARGSSISTVATSATR